MQELTSNHQLELRPIHERLPHVKSLCLPISCFFLALVGPGPAATARQGGPQRGSLLEPPSLWLPLRLLLVRAPGLASPASYSSVLSRLPGGGRPSESACPATATRSPPVRAAHLQRGLKS